MKTIDFGVKCSNFNLMKAFKEECESMGWSYQWEFNQFNEDRHRQYPAMYFTDDWHGEPFGFSLTNLGDVVKVFHLPQDWDKAVEHAKKMIKLEANLQLNNNYEAKINFRDKTVAVGCQRFTFDKINELAELINKNKK